MVSSKISRDPTQSNGTIGAHVSNSESTTANEQDGCLATVPEVAKVGRAPTVLSEAHINARSNLAPLHIPDVRGVNSPANSSPTSLQSGKTMSVTSPYTRVVPLVVNFETKERSGLRHTRSTSGLAHRLSHKISYTFSNPTVVHRPNLRVRPSLAAIHTSPSLPILDQNLQVDTDPSSTNSGSGSPEETSTEKTSPESTLASTGSTMHRDVMKRGFTRLNRTTIHEQAVPGLQFPTELPRVPLPVVVKPTMLTVETAASTKIFFETHFNSVLSGQSTPRSLRRQELEAFLRSEPFTEEQKQLERLAWAKQETDNLRLSRVQRSKSQQRAKGLGIAIAGYEVMRILGKGSFGVVRLVREKGSNSSESSTSSPIRHLSFTREELSSLRMTAINTVRRTLGSQSSSPSISPRPKSPRTCKVKREVFAMKVIRKSDMLKNSQESHLRAERDFLVASEKSRWVVPLIAAFQDETNLYLVMEYMIGGDFLGLLIRYDRLKEKTTRWYVAEMVLCIEEAHRLRWIHRDVKPDNFLISASGHLKISDFGLAFDGHWSHAKGYVNNQRYSLMEKLGIKVEGDAEDRKESNKAKLGDKVADVIRHRKAKKSLEMQFHQVPSQRSGSDRYILNWRDKHARRKLAESIVGTSQYMAPEVVRGDPYDGRCDWWSIGIIMFEV